MAEEKENYSQMPEKISDTPENIMKAIVNTPPPSLEQKVEQQPKQDDGHSRK